MGDALRDLALNASNFSVGEYAPQKLALIPGDASGTATLRVHVTRRSKLMLGRVVSWKHEQTNGVLRCAGGCACAEYEVPRWHRRQTTISEAIEIAVSPRPRSQQPVLAAVRPAAPSDGLRHGDAGGQHTEEDALPEQLVGDTRRRPMHWQGRETSGLRRSRLVERAALADPNPLMHLV